MGLPIKGGVSNVLADVNANHELNTALSALKDNAGFVKIAASADEGLGMTGGVKTIREADATEDYRLRIGQDSILFQEGFPGTAINSSIWGLPIASSTAVVAGGFLTLNNGGSAISAQGAMLRSHRTFPVFATFPLFFETLLNITNLTFNNATAEWGLNNIGVAPGTAGVDGMFFRLTASGLSCVLANNASEIAEITIDPTKLSVNSIVLTNTNHYLIAVNDDSVTYWINDIKFVSIPRPTVGASVTHSQQLPIFARQINTSTNTLNALKVNIAMITISVGDMDMGKPWSHRKAGAGDMIIQSITGQAVAKTSTGIIASGAAPTEMSTWSATALGTGGAAGLGGLQVLSKVGTGITLTADTPGLIFSYQIPALATAAPVTPAKSLVLTAIKISAMSRGAAGPGNLGVFHYILFVGGLGGASPATAENAATPAKLARPLSLGMHSIIATAPIGTMFTPDIQLAFDSPLVWQPGEWFTIMAIPLVGYAIAANQQIFFTCTPIGYWE